MDRPKQIQISMDLFADLMLYFGVQTEPDPSEERYQRIHDGIALKVKAVNDRRLYRVAHGLTDSNPSRVAINQGQRPAMPQPTADNIAENQRLEALYEQGRRLGYHD